MTKTISAKKIMVYTQACKGGDLLYGDISTPYFSHLRPLRATIRVYKYIVDFIVYLF